MIVMDETSCMVDVARFFMEFCMDESCGKCVPCRVGTAQMLELLRKITDGEATPATSRCSRSSASVVQGTEPLRPRADRPEPGAQTLRYFRDEYLTHIDGEALPRPASARCARRRPRR